MPSDVQYVSSRARLQECLDSILQSERVGLDTEFVGEGLYEPGLCLVQLATTDGLWLVDPYSAGDLEPLWEALTAPERELVVVAAREEVRFCLRYARRPPARLFDAQIAAGLVGYGYPLSHTNLVRTVLGIQVSGGETFTDWRKRPLSNSQLEYAADDVRHLLPMREKLLAEAERLDRVAWVEEECSRYVQRITEGEQEERWWKVSGSGSLGRKELAVLRELWRWRDETARADNVPPRKVLRDEIMVEIVKRKPASTNDLFALRGLERGSIRAAAAEIVAAVQRALKLPQSEWPPSLRRDDPPQVQVLSQLLSVVASAMAAENRVDAGLLYTVADLQDLVRWRLRGERPDDPLPLLLTGWRETVLGDALRQILEGRGAIRVGDLRKDNPLVFDPLTGRSG